MASRGMSTYVILVGGRDSVDELLRTEIELTRFRVLDGILLESRVRTSGEAAGILRYRSNVFLGHYKGESRGI